MRKKQQQQQQQQQVKRQPVSEASAISTVELLDTLTLKSDSWADEVEIGVCRSLAHRHPFVSPPPVCVSVYTDLYFC